MSVGNDLFCHLTELRLGLVERQSRTDRRAEKMNLGQSGVTPVVDEVFTPRMVNHP
jgi:hypothetical protein